MVYVLFLWQPPASGNTDATSGSGFLSFTEEASRVTHQLSCQSAKVAPADPAWGALYGCITGRAKTAKIWINEEPYVPGVVENIKVMWNDWSKDIGHGVHADAREAEFMVRALAKLYVPDLEDQLVDTFRGSTPRKFSAGTFKVEYLWKRGPAIDEHLMVISSP